MLRGKYHRELSSAWNELAGLRRSLSNSKIYRWIKHKDDVMMGPQAQQGLRELAAYESDIMPMSDEYNVAILIARDLHYRNPETTVSWERLLEMVAAPGYINAKMYFTYLMCEVTRQYPK
jgi:hypothetical protein